MLSINYFSENKNFKRKEKLKYTYVIIDCFFNPLQDIFYLLKSQKSILYFKTITCNFKSTAADSFQGFCTIMSKNWSGIKVWAPAVTLAYAIAFPRSHRILTEER